MIIDQIRGAATEAIGADGNRIQVFFLTSIENSEKAGGVKGGVVFDIPGNDSPEEAARLIAQKTHRLSTPEEIEGFYADMKRRTHECAVTEDRKKQQYAMPPELKDLVAAAVQGVVAQQQVASKPGKVKD